jgi:phenylalanine-4-hydroxylase
VFHDFFGHVPLLFDRTYADHLHEYGKGGLKAMRLDAVKMLARLYWYTIEFGLMSTAAGIRAYGAGLLSSGGELAYCVDDAKPRRLPFDLERIMRTDYLIDRYQDTYFVIDSFEQLMRETAPDFTPIYQRIRNS